MLMLQYSKLFQLARPYINTDSKIEIKRGERFTCTYDIFEDTFTITVSDDQFTNTCDDARFIIDHCKAVHGLKEGYDMTKDFIKCFALFHELGHINGYFEDNRKEYEALQDISNNYDRKKAYRMLDREYEADAIATQIINENILTIWYILNPDKSKEENKQELEFWSCGLFN